MNGDRMVARNMTMSPSDLAALQQVAKDEGLSSVSAAMRFVLRRYLRQQMVVELAPGQEAFRAAFGAAGEQGESK
ncbi:MAG: ribbon-helix-helix protein, CopG family [Chloroflexota bacterium]|nr:ribbon-helix-helix protein, CopG family [Chloroflexota bacterium]